MRTLQTLREPPPYPTLMCIRESFKGEPMPKVTSETQVVERSVSGRLKMQDSDYQLLRFIGMRQGLATELETVKWILSQYFETDKTREKLNKALA